MKQVEAKTEVIQALSQAASKPPGRSESEALFFEDVSKMQSQFTYHKYKENFKKTMKLRRDHEVFKKNLQ